MREHAELILAGDEEIGDGSVNWRYTGLTDEERGTGSEGLHLLEQQDCALDWSDLDSITPGA
jgi:hypothetical protein